MPLHSEEFFKTVHIDRGSVVWGNWDVDIAAEELYTNGQELQQA